MTDNKDSGGVRKAESVVTTIAEKEGFKIGKFKIETKAISTDGANYMGDLFLIDVIEEGKETLNLFAKVTNIPEAARGIIPANDVYQNEVNMYTVVAEAFRELEDRHAVPEVDRYIFPKYYGSNLKELEEVVVLENLAAQDYVVYDRFKILDWEYTKAALKEIAKFHALSFALQEEKPQDFETLLKSVKNVFADNQQQNTEVLGNLLMISSSVVEPENKSRLVKFIDENKSTFGKKYIGPTSKYSVIAHGDYRASNILVKYQGNSVTSLKPIDYQTASYGSPINDIIYLLFTGTDEDYRREYFDDYLEHYYNSLANHLKLLSQDIKNIYPKSVFYFEVKDKLCYGLELAVFLLSVVLVEPKEKPEMGGMVSEEAAVAVFESMKPGKVYTERLNGIVRDFVRWGYLQEDDDSNVAVPGFVQTVISSIAEKEGFKKYKIVSKPMSTKGANYMGDLHLVDVIENGKKTLNLFAKVNNSSESARKMIPVNEIYEKEVFMYTTMAETFNEIQEKHGVPEEKRFKLPKYYGSSLKEMEEVVVLENLAAQGYELYDRFKPIDWEYAKAALEEIAKFHALSFALKKEMPEVYDRLKNSVKNSIADSMAEYMEKTGKDAFMQTLGLVEPENQGRIKKYIEENKFGALHFDLSSKYNILIHADYRMSNILVKYQGNRVTSLKPVDYQTVFYGNPLNDILYFLFTGSDEHFRRQHFEAYLEHYHSSLADHLKLLSQDINYILPKSAFYFELNKTLKYGLEVAFSTLAIVLVEHSQNLNMEDMVDPETSKEEFAKFMQNDVYKERLNGIVRDFVRWGFLEDAAKPAEQPMSVSAVAVNGSNRAKEQEKSISSSRKSSKKKDSSCTIM